MKIVYHPANSRKNHRAWWKLVASNGQILATSEIYESNRNCLKTARRVARRLKLPLVEYTTKKR